MIRSAIIFVALTAAPVRAQDADSSDHWDARITAAAGQVVLHPVDGSPAVEAEADMPLEQGDRVVTSSGSTAEIALDGDSLILLRENTDFTLENTRKSESIFSLALGSLLAKIQKLGAGRLSVRSPTAVAAVRGTEFGVDVEAGQSSVGVFEEGSVEVRGSAGGSEVLSANQETSVSRGQAPLKAAPLSRFASRRAAMRAHVGRLLAVRRNWKALTPAQRRAARVRALKRSGRRLQNRKARGRVGQNSPRRRQPQRRPPERRKPRRKLPGKNAPKPKENNP